MGATWILRRIMLLALILSSLASLVSGEEWKYIEGKPVCGTKEGKFTHPENPAVQLDCVMYSDENGKPTVMRTYILPCPPETTVNAEGDCTDANGKGRRYLKAPDGVWMHTSDRGWWKPPGTG